MRVKTISVNNSLSFFTLTAYHPPCERDHTAAVYLIPSIPYPVIYGPSCFQMPGPLTQTLPPAWRVRAVVSGQEGGLD